MRLAELTLYGGITVMLPTALVVAGWLWFSKSREAALLWGATLFFSYAIVGASKILFKGWGVGLEKFDIAVISGHAMNSCLVITVVLSLLARQISQGLRWPAAGVGLLLTWWFSINCVAPYLHPLPEAVAGAFLGTSAACLFLYLLESREAQTISSGALALGLLLIALNTLTTKHTAEGLLDQIAISLSGQEKAFKQPHWRLKPGPS